jgi:4-hydroxy-tetrahydrodipicolinate reductase
VEVLIDFSIPDVAFENIQTGLKLGKQIVIGTTGWYDKLEAVKKQVKSTSTGLVYASNFSLGVNLFYKLVKQSSEIMGKFKEYDPFVEEMHHQFKKDAPSGTALEILKLMKSGYSEQEIPVTSVRGGFIPGTHIVTYDSKVDSIQLSHSARNREGLARGALMAANWIHGKTGFYHFSEILDDVF